uniref:Predicted readthrough transcript, 44501 n=1 Tax=Mus musculus TaxID=10090 RepID=A0A3B2WCV0_MOUSE
MEEAIPAKTKDYESNFHVSVMTSLPMMIFLVILLLPSMPTEGRAQELFPSTRTFSLISLSHGIFL